MKIIVPRDARDLAQDLIGELRNHGIAATLLSRSETTAIIVVSELPDALRRHLQQVPGVQIED